MQDGIKPEIVPPVAAVVNAGNEDLVAPVSIWQVFCGDAPQVQDAIWNREIAGYRISELLNHKCLFDLFRPLVKS